MRIECAWCKAEVGEKCPNCGWPAAGLVEPENPPGPENHFVCHHCAHVFLPGDGGTSATICDPCRVGVGISSRRLTEQDIVDRAARRGSR